MKMKQIDSQRIVNLSLMGNSTAKSSWSAAVLCRLGMEGRSREGRPQASGFRPRRCRTTALQVYSLLLTCVLLTACSGGGNESSEAGEGTVYTCSMHPQIREQQPGDCPLCGMDLVAVSESKENTVKASNSGSGSGETASGTVYTCPMHPQIREGKAGDCPLCGMDLVQADAGGKTPSGDHSDCPTCSGDTSPSVELGRAKNAILSAETETAGPHPLEKEIEIFGEIEAVRDLLIRFSWDYSGRIESVLPDYNRQSYRQGEPILEVYSAEAVAEQERLIELWRKRWLTTFYERRNIESQIAAVKTRLEEGGMTQNDFEALREKGQIRRTFILKAPAGGSVLMAPPEVGSHFRAGETLFETADLDSVWFVGDAFEKDIGYLESGQEGLIQSQGLPGVSFQGKLVYLGRSLNATTRTLPVRFLVDNDSGRLLPKLSGTARLKISLGNDRVTVPARAVLETGKRSVVYVAQGEGMYRLRNVKTGIRTDDRIEILEGVKSGEEVVTDGAFLLDAEAQLSGQAGGMEH